MQPNDEELENYEEDGLYVNFSDQEAATEGRDIEPLPSGKYLCTITDVDLRLCGPESKNPGKKYYAVEFTVVEDKRGGEFVNRKCWTNAMLFSPALYTIVQIMKAIGIPVNSGKGRIPEPSELIDQIVVVAGRYVGEQVDKKDPSKVYSPKFEPKSIMARAMWDSTGGAITGKKASSSARSSLLS